MFGEHLFGNAAGKWGVSMHWVLYLEVQGFYAAVARKAGLAAVDQPVVVLREGRVYDGSREAFASGLVAGSPARQALRDAPQAITVPYEQLEPSAVARSWWDRCLDYTPYIEPADQNQVFLALPVPGQQLSATLKNEVTRLAEIAASYGFVAFAGLGSSKLVARAAALACKENWLLWRPGKASPLAPETMRVVLPGEEERFLSALPVTYLPALPEVQRRLLRLGIRRIGEAAQIPEGEWLRQLGPLGRQVALWSHGVDPEPVKPCYPPRTLERHVQFTPEVRERDLLEQVLNRTAAALSQQLSDRGEGCQEVALTLQSADGRQATESRTLARLQQSTYPLQQALVGLLAKALQPAGEGAASGAEICAAALTVRLGIIGPMPWQQMDLWDDSGRCEREERLEKALSLLQERFPARMVGLGPRGELSWREQMLHYHDPYRTQSTGRRG